MLRDRVIIVVADTTKVRIFKQITTSATINPSSGWLLLILQRYEFSSKSQLKMIIRCIWNSCCWYYKGTNFQANHNNLKVRRTLSCVVADTTKVRIFKQITTNGEDGIFNRCCCWYYKGTNLRENIFTNHNYWHSTWWHLLLLLILQRYEFSSKSQPYDKGFLDDNCCCWYYKGTNFQANHNNMTLPVMVMSVVADTTKVRIFKQITTDEEEQGKER